jgi:hypothetical protein
MTNDLDGGGSASGTGDGVDPTPTPGSGNPTRVIDIDDRVDDGVDARAEPDPAIVPNNEPNLPKSAAREAPPMVMRDHPLDLMRNRPEKKSPLVRRSLRWLLVLAILGGLAFFGWIAYEDLTEEDDGDVEPVATVPNGDTNGNTTQIAVVVTTTLP